MPRQCPECRTAVTTGGSWCGNCGALLEEEHAAGRDRRQFVALFGVLTAAAAVVLLVLGPDIRPGRGSGDSPAEDPTGAVALPVPSGDPASGGGIGGLVVRWERPDLAIGTTDVRVRAAGGQHVVVGGRVVATTEGVTQSPGAGRLVGALRGGAIAPDGTWAVAEGGAVTTGSLASGRAQSVEVAADGWTPHGPAVAWRAGQAVFTGTGGLLGRVGAQGEVTWRSDVPVAPTGPVADGWLAGRTEAGEHVAVDLDDGSSVRLPSAPIVLLGDVAASIEGGEVVVRGLPDGSVLWRRGDAGEGLVGVTAGLVAFQTDGAVLLDPRTGAVVGRVDGGDPVPVGDVVVVHRGTQVDVERWDGTHVGPIGGVTGGAELDVVRIDDARVALVVTSGGASTVRVMDPVTGARLALVPPDDPVPDRPVLSTAQGSVSFRGVSPLGGTTWLDPATGAPVAAPSGGASPAPATSTELSTRAADDDPFGLLPPVLVATRADGGDVLWEAPALAAVGPRGQGPVTIGPLASEAGPVVVEVGAATLRARSAATGTVTWVATMRAPITAVPVATGAARLVVPLADGSLAALDPARGTVLWRAVVGEVPTALAADRGEALVGTSGGLVLRLDSLGRPAASVVLGERSVLELVAAGDVVVVMLPDRVVGVAPSDP